MTDTATMPVEFSVVDNVVDLDVADLNTDDNLSVVCEVCGAEFVKQSGLNIHLGHVHPDRADLQKRSTSRRPRKPRAVPLPDYDDSDNPVRSSTNKDVARIKRTILKSFNPGFVDVVVATGVPREIIDVPGLPDNRSIREELYFTELQAEILAQGIVRMNGTSLATAVGRVAGPILPYAFGLAALAVIIGQAIKVFALRNMVQQLMNQNQVQSVSSNGNGPDGPSANSPRYI